MKIHLLFLLFFLLDLAGLWLVHYRPAWRRYRWPGQFLLLLLPLLTVFFSQPTFQLDYFWWRVAGGPLLAVGIALLAWSLITFQFQGGGEKLVTSGPYNYVRHPQYLGLIFVWVGWWWLWGGVYSFYFGMFFVALIWLQGWLEEKLALARKFPAEYADYRCYTGMFWLK